jgi:hypothetical protein
MTKSPAFSRYAPNVPLPNVNIELVEGARLPETRTRLEEDELATRGGVAWCRDANCQRLLPYQSP